jgi:Ras-related protein Rab-1A
MLIGNKCDAASRKAVTYQDGKDRADELGMDFLETSAKDTTNVEAAFLSIAAVLKAKHPKAKLVGTDKIGE